MDYSYVHINAVRDDLGETGSDATWLDFVKAGTTLVEKAFMGGAVPGPVFVPLTEARRFDGNGGKILFTPDLLSSAPTIVDDVTTLGAADYLLYPRNRRWRNGPYFRIELDPDATGLSSWTVERDIISVTGKWGWYDESEVISGATVVSTVVAGSLTWTIETGKVRVGHLLLVESELVFVTAVTVASPNDTVTVVRGVLGTTAAGHAGGVAISQQVAPYDIQWITKSVVASLWKRAKSGYTGKTVVPELGQINLFDVLPKEAIKEAKMVYHREAAL